MNAFGAGADRFTEVVRERMGQLGYGQQQNQENGTRQTDGPPVGERYAIDDRGKIGYHNSSKELELRGEPENKPKTAREWSAFNRSFANKTAGMKPGEVRMIMITTADYVYLVEADGYMQGYAEEKVLISERNLDRIQRMGRFIDGFNRNRETYDSWLASIWTRQRRTRGDYGNDGQRGTARRTDKLYGKEQERDSSGYYSGNLEDLEEINYESLGPGTMYWDGENAYEVVETENGLVHQRIQLEEESNSEEKAERYSLDPDYTEEDFARVQAEMNADQRQWGEMFLENRLGSEGAERYRAWEKQQEQNRKQRGKEKQVYLILIRIRILLW